MIRTQMQARGLAQVYETSSGAAVTSFEQVLNNFRTRLDAASNWRSAKYHLGKLEVGASLTIPLPDPSDPRGARRIREAAYQDGQRRNAKYSVRSTKLGTAIVTRLR